MSFESARKPDRRITPNFHLGRAVRSAPAIGGVAILVWAGGEFLGLNLDSKQASSPAVPAHELLGPTDSTAPDIQCEGKGPAVSLGKDGAPATLSELVSSPQVIPNAHLNEGQALDAIAALNPNINLRYPDGKVLQLPAFCLPTNG
jgi:hypothetical protein